MNSKPLIVLVEDNAPDVFLIRTALQQAGFQFELQVFADGDEAFTHLAADDVQQPDLMLIDLNLPKRSGRDLLQGLMERSTSALPLFIVISSSDSAEDKMAAHRLGAARFFNKPAELDEFMKLGNVVADVLQLAL